VVPNASTRFGKHQLARRIERGDNPTQQHSISLVPMGTQVRRVAVHIRAVAFSAAAYRTPLACVHPERRISPFALCACLMVGEPSEGRRPASPAECGAPRGTNLRAVWAGAGK